MLIRVIARRRTRRRRPPLKPWQKRIASYPIAPRTWWIWRQKSDEAKGRWHLVCGRRKECPYAADGNGYSRQTVSDIITLYRHRSNCRGYSGRYSKSYLVGPFSDASIALAAAQLAKRYCL